MVIVEESVSVWFVCKLCRASLSTVATFIEHKKKQHLTEFKKIKSIFFEETAYDENEADLQFRSNTAAPVPTHPQLPEAPQLTLVKQESNYISENNDEDPIDGVVDPLVSYQESALHCGFQPITELITFHNEIMQDDDKPPKVNKVNPNNATRGGISPMVRVQRLTSQEIVAAVTATTSSTATHFETSDHYDSNQNDYDGGNYSVTLQDLKEFMDKDNNATNCNNIDDEAGGGEPVQKSNEGNFMTYKNPVNPFECNLCGRSFGRDLELKIHVGICMLYNKPQSIKPTQEIHCVNKIDRPNNIVHELDSDSNSSDLRLNSEHSVKVDSASQVKHLGINSTDKRPYKCKNFSCFASFSNPYHLLRHEKSFHLNPLPEPPPSRSSWKLKSKPVVPEPKPKPKPKPKTKQLGNLIKAPKDSKSHEVNGSSTSFQELKKRQISKLTKTTQKRRKRKPNAKLAFKCPEIDCGKRFTSKQNLTHHRERKHNPDAVRKFACNLCSSAFFSKHVLQNHVLSVHGEGRKGRKRQETKTTKRKSRYVCSQEGCLKSFNCQITFRLHVANQCMDLEYMCAQDNCQEVFDSNKNLDLHLEARHAGEERIYGCHICRKKFNFKSGLYAHVLVHSTDKPFECTVEGCTAAFKRKQELTYHVCRNHLPYAVD